MAKSEVASTGKVRPTAIFVYENEAGTSEASTTKTIILDWRDELQKEALIRRIREKALAERASAVLTLTEAEPESRSRPQGRGMLMLSGVAPGVHLSARVDYAIGSDTKSVTSWEMRYLDKPVQNVFLDGIFPLERRPVQTGIQDESLRHCFLKASARVLPKICSISNGTVQPQ